MTNPFESITDKLLSTFSESNLEAIALKVSKKYNDNAVEESLKPKTIIDDAIADIKAQQKELFANSDKAFLEAIAPNQEFANIADDVASEIVEGFNK